jgi:arylsulfatase A-like enzyme
LWYATMTKDKHNVADGCFSTVCYEKICLKETNAMQIVLYAIGSWLIYLAVDFLFLLFSSWADAAYYSFVLVPDEFTIIVTILCYMGIGLFIGLGLKSVDVLSRKKFFANSRNRWAYLTVTLSLELNCLMNIFLLYKNYYGATSLLHITFLRIIALFTMIVLCAAVAAKISHMMQKSPAITLISVSAAGETFLSIMREGLFGSLTDSFIGGNSVTVIAAAFFISSIFFSGSYFFLPRLFAKSGKRGLHVFLYVFMSFLLYAGTPETSFAGQVAPAPRRPNVVLIIIDTLRADHLSCYGYPRKTTPNIDAFALQAVKYNYAYATAPWTLPSIASIMTGMYPVGHGADRLNATDYGDNPALAITGLNKKYTPLAALLKNSGYTTAGAISVVWLQKKYGLNQGFDYYDENIPSAGNVMRTCAALSFLNIFFPFNDFLISRGHNDRRIGDQVNASVIDWLNQYKSTDPFFLLVHYFDVHHPYFPQKLGMQSVPCSIKSRYAKCANYSDVEKQITDSVIQRQKKLLPDEKEFLTGNYDEHIASVDAKIGRLFSRLKEMNLYDESMIIIVSDHGEAFGEHDLMLHGICLYDDNLHVPLLIKYPLSDQKKETVDYPVSLTGFVPTILSYLSIRIPDYVQGAPFSDQQHQVILANNVKIPAPPWRLPDSINTDTVALLQDGYKLIKFINKHDQLFDLKKDPHETMNIISQEGSPNPKLQAEMKTYIQKYSKSRSTKRDIQEGVKATLESLRNLGYVK